MPFDALFLSAMTQELAPAVGARIDRVQQPARDTLLFSLRSRQGSWKLLVTANPNHPRVQFTSLLFENPQQPPMFCMLLRKHLTGARIAALTQTPMERVLDLSLDCLDELGEPAQKHLILELMGRTSNVVLTGADGRIIDCLRRVDLEMSAQRQLLPGLFYHAPLPQEGKKNPYEMQQEDFLALLRSVSSPMRLDRLLQQHLNGLSPLLCRELSFRVSGQTDADVLQLQDLPQAARVLWEFFAALPPFYPTILLEAGVPKEFSCAEILQYGDFLQREHTETCSALLDRFFGKKEQSERQRQRAQQLTRLVTNCRDRVRRKLELQKKERETSQDRERLRRYGDLVTANFYQMRRGQAVLRTQDFYDPALREIEIPLSVQLSPQQNAAKYYKDYAKAKHAEQVLTEQIERGARDLAYLESVLEELARAESDRDLEEIRAELIDQGYLRRTDRKKQMKQPASRPMEFTSSTGFPLLVGRNNRQNDQLTLKLADRRDIWLHAQKIHGSHVIIVCRGAEPDDETMTQAAQLAAYYSQAREGQNVAVDTTRVRNVKKPAGALPGMVVYEHYQTLYVTPSPLPALRTK